MADDIQLNFSFDGPAPRAPKPKFASKKDRLAAKRAQQSPARATGAGKPRPGGTAGKRPSGTSTEGARPRPDGPPAKRFKKIQPGAASSGGPPTAPAAYRRPFLPANIVMPKIRGKLP
jgi:hypothetical protein